jgi:hypothetical protein
VVVLEGLVAGESVRFEAQTMKMKGVHWAQTRKMKKVVIQTKKMKRVVIHTKKKKRVVIQTRKMKDYSIGQDYLLNKGLDNCRLSKTLCRQSTFQPYQLLTVCRTLLPFAYLSHLYSIFKYNDATFSPGQCISNRRQPFMG